MKCEDIVDLLSAYIDEELGADERRRIETHLQGCAGCQASLEALRDTVSMVKGLGMLDVPDHVSHALSQVAVAGNAKAARTKPAKSRSWIPPIPYLLGASAAATIALVLLLSQLNTGMLDTAGTAQKTLLKSEKLTAQESGLPEASQPHDIDFGTNGQVKDEALKGVTRDDKANDELMLRGLPDGSGSVQSYAGRDAAKEAVKSEAAPSQGALPEIAKELPIVTGSKTNYNEALANKLLDDIFKKTEGVYTIEDAKTQRAATMDTLVSKVTAIGGDGKLVRGPIDVLLDGTKRDGLPVYLEKAKFNKKDSLIIIIRWGFGSEQNSLDRASLYITDLSGWNTAYYVSK